MKGVLERIEDNRIAVILIEEEHREIYVPLKELPPGTGLNTWFHIELEGGEVVSLRIDEDATEERSHRADEIRQKLLSKRTGSKFRRR